MSNFANSGMKVRRYRSSPTSWVWCLFLSVYSSSEVLAKITSIRIKLPTAACWSREKKERKLWSQLALCLRDHRHHRQIIHSVLRPLRGETLNYKAVAMQNFYTSHLWCLNIKEQSFWTQMFYRRSLVLFRTTAIFGKLRDHDRNSAKTQIINLLQW